MTSWQFSLLWTDWLIWALVLMVLCFVMYIVKTPHQRLAWQKVFCRPIHLCASMVLGAFILVGLMDSIHLKMKASSDQTGGIVSVLDLALKPVKDGMESSYSAPMSTHAFTKEVIELSDGQTTRDYPRLEYGGAHLTDLALKSQDIQSRLLILLAQSAIVWFGICMAIAAIFCLLTKNSIEDFLGSVIKGERLFPWRTLLGMLGIFVALIFIINGLMSYYHLLGTSKIGEDVLYQSMKSIRTGLVIGTLTTLFMLPLALTLGLMAGYFRGIIDDIIQYIYTTLSSIPGVLLIASAVLTLQVVMSKHQFLFETQAQRSDARLLALCVILGITSWTGLCRLLRAETLKLREIEFVQAARVLGVKHFKIIFKHLLPNVAHIILISMALDFSGLVLAEAVLSYVGVGVDPSSYSWGTMINGARLELARAPVVWWSLLSAFAFMFTLVLAANIFADAVRDAFDPRV